MSDDARLPPKQQTKAGRVGFFMKANPFWQQVTVSVVSSLIAAYVIAWAVTSIALAAQVGQVEYLSVSDVVTWSVLFVLFGMALSTAALLAYLLVDAPPEPFGAWRGRAVARGATNMVVVYFLIVSILGLGFTVLIGGLLVVGPYALVIQGIFVRGGGRSARAVRLPGAATLKHRLVLALGLLMALAEAALIGLSLGLTYSDITT